MGQLFETKECKIFKCEKRNGYFCCDYCYMNKNCDERCLNNSKECNLSVKTKGDTNEKRSDKKT